MGKEGSEISEILASLWPHFRITVHTVVVEWPFHHKRAPLIKE